MWRSGHWGEADVFATPLKGRDLPKPDVAARAGSQRTAPPAVLEPRPRQRVLCYGLT
jgi:hypothetical protein